MNMYREYTRDLMVFSGLCIISSLLITAIIGAWVDIPFTTIIRAAFLTTAYIIATYYIINIMEFTEVVSIPIWPLFSIIPYTFGWWSFFDELSNSKWPFWKHGVANPHPEWYATSLFQWASLLVLIGILYLIDYAIKDK